MCDCFLPPDTFHSVHPQRTGFSNGKKHATTPHDSTPLISQAVGGGKGIYTVLYHKTLKHTMGWKQQGARESQQWEKEEWLSFWISWQKDLSSHAHPDGWLPIGTNPRAYRRAGRLNGWGQLIHGSVILCCGVAERKGAGCPFPDGQRLPRECLECGTFTVEIEIRG